MGTNVISGTGTGLVVRTGLSTAFGSLARKLTGRRVETEFDRGVSRVSRLLIRFTVFMVPIVFFINGFSKDDWGRGVLFCAFGCGGPDAGNAAHDRDSEPGAGAMNMSKKKVIVKRLHSIQNFGAMDVLCSDKTGTLTQDRVVLERHLDMLGRDSEKVLQLGYLNSYYQTGLKNLLDVAILKHAEIQEDCTSQQITGLRIEIPFDFSRRRMSVVVETPNGELAHHQRCHGRDVAHRRRGSQPRLVPLDDDLRNGALAMAQDLNSKGFRVIAVGYRKFPLGKGAYSVAEETELILAGLMAFVDPPKESAAPAIRALNDHGVAVKILTGDNETVTRRICEDVGIDPGRILLGSDIEAMDNGALCDAVGKTTVFAKVSPTQKARIIEVLKRCGHVVVPRRWDQ